MNRFWEITASDGKNYKTKFYSLDAIIAVGYRVNSKLATDFRIWATKTLKEFISKGFVLEMNVSNRAKRRLCPAIAGLPRNLLV
ncbi:MAG: virulence RhuM family protein [Bacteroidales bacterium]|nr:virulence RhuM family protein [Bacteroidales bacterium]